jgi:hypothetical protein
MHGDDAKLLEHLRPLHFQLQLCVQVGASGPFRVHAAQACGQRNGHGIITCHHHPCGDGGAATLLHVREVWRFSDAIVPRHLGLCSLVGRIGSNAFLATCRRLRSTSHGLPTAFCKQGRASQHLSVVSWLPALQTRPQCDCVAANVRLSVPSLSTEGHECRQSYRS